MQHEPPNYPPEAFQPPRPQGHPHQGQPIQQMLAHRGELILGLGVGGIAVAFLGCICFGPLGIAGGVMGLVAAIMGAGDLAKMKRGVMDQRGQGNTIGGTVCGAVAAAFGVLLLLLFAAVMLMYAGVFTIAALDGQF